MLSMLAGGAVEAIRLSVYPLMIPVSSQERAKCMAQNLQTSILSMHAGWGVLMCMMFMLASGAVEAIGLSPQTALSTLDRSILCHRGGLIFRMCVQAGGCLCACCPCWREGQWRW